MGDCMNYLDTPMKFIKEYSFKDKKEIYTNGTELVPLFRVEQMLGNYMPMWIPVMEQLPEEKINPITTDFYEYQVTIKICGTIDVRHYKFGNGQWWNGGSNMTKHVIAWMPLSEPYKEES